MAQHVLQQQVNAKLTTPAGNPVEGNGGMVHVLEKFLIRRAPFALGAGVEHHMLTTQSRGGFAGENEFRDGLFASALIEGGDVDARRKRRVKRGGVNLQGEQTLGGVV
jgi:hypothetical protein